MRARAEATNAVSELSYSRGIGTSAPPVSTRGRGGATFMGSSRRCCLLSGSQSVCGAARGSQAGRGGNLEKDVLVPGIFVEDMCKRNLFGRVGLGLISAPRSRCAPRGPRGFPVTEGLDSMPVTMFTFPWTFFPNGVGFSVAVTLPL